MADGKRSDVSDSTVGGASERQRVSLSEREKYLIYLVAGIVLVAVAVAVLFVEGHSTPLSKCKGVLLSGPRDACLTALAVSSDNASICSFAGFEQQQCITSVAERYSSQSTCDLLSNETYKYQCTLNVSLRTSTPSACATLGNYSSQCYYSYAKQGRFSNKTICSLITNSTEKSYCNAVSNYNLALDTGNQSYCGLVPGSSDSSILYLLLNYSTLSANSTDYLYYEYYNFTPRDYCYFNLAVKYNNSAACSRMSSSIGSLCNGYLAALSKKSNSAQAFNLTAALAACTVVPSSLQNACSSSAYTAAAETYDNVSYCTEIQNETYFASCIDALAQYYNDTAYCSYIKNSTAQSSCYLQ